MVYIKKQKKSFSKIEGELFHLLKANKNRVLNRGTILEHIWNISGGKSDGSLEAYMTFLRRKIKKQGDHSIIKTINGLGYMLQDTSD